MNAATKIQASFRGHMARKQAEKSKNDGEISKEMEKLQSKVTIDRYLSCFFKSNIFRSDDDKIIIDIDSNVNIQSPVANEEELDVDLSDPSLNHAATKIQASFRGHMTRKTLVKD